jgi:opacity protein-like surface antigen
MKSSKVGMWAATVIVALSFSSLALAQDARSEVSVQGTGFFTGNSDHDAIHDKVTNSGGLLTGYRFNINHWIAAEADYGYARNSQEFYGKTSGRVESNVHEITGSAVAKLPSYGRLHPFVLAGGGALVFDPTNKRTNYGGVSRETRGAFLYGAGADYTLAKHWALRAEYRGLVYEAPGFNVASLRSNAWTHAAQPSAGIVYKF